MSLTTTSKSGIEPPQTASARARARLLVNREALIGYLFVAPVLGGIVLFQLYPILVATYLSLTDWDGISQRHFVGLANYWRLLSEDELFHKVVLNTVVFMAGAIPLTTLLALGLALLCNRKLPAMGIFRVAFFVPFVANSVAIGFVWYWFYAPNNGVLNGLLGVLGIQGTSWLTHSGWAMVALVAASVWQSVGYPMVVFLAGLQTIPDSLYAAAKVDGAGAWRRFRHVTLPLLTPSTFFVLITQFISTFQVFGIVFVMTQGGPNNATNVFMLNLYRTAFGAGKVGYASAMAWIMFTVIAAATIVQWRLQLRWVHYEWPSYRTNGQETATREEGRLQMSVTDTTAFRHAGILAYYAAMSVLTVAFLLPLIWMVSSSLKHEADVFTIPPQFIPRSVTLANYAQAGQTILPYLWNSVKIAALSVAGLLITAPLAGYAFARLKFPGRDVLFLLLLGSSLIPHIAYLIPQYIVFRDFGWLDTHYPLWVPRAFTPIFGTFLMRQFFKSLPRELEDAARVDGAGTFTVYWRIMLPLSKPALAAVGIFTFVEAWNDLLGPLIFVNSTELQTLPVALALFQGEFFTQVSALMAAATLTIVPVLLVFAFCQRYFIEGLASTGLKV